MANAEFDRFAATYEEMHARSIRLSGEAPDWFAAYKVEIVAALTPCRANDLRILDFGGGTGNSLGHFRRLFPAARITRADPSSQSLEIARSRFPGAAAFVTLADEALPFDDGSFDIAFAACVFHHIPEAGHGQALRELHRVLRPGGSLFVFEHNPMNPLTRKAVRDCPFDEGAVLIRGREMRSRIELAGFTRARERYRIFFPHPLRSLRRFEPRLEWLPLGGQYFVHARR